MKINKNGKLDLFNNVNKIDYIKLNKVLKIYNEEIENNVDKDNMFFYGVNYLIFKSPNIHETNKIRTVKREFSNQNIIKIVLDFYKSIDLEMYHSALTLLTDQSPNSISIYDDNTKNNLLKEKDWPKYLNHPTFLHNCTELKIDKDNIINQKAIGKIYAPKKGALSDLYTVAHEITHTFDFPENFSRNNKTRNIFGEVLSNFIEKTLDDYLLKNNIITEKELLYRRREHYDIIKIDAISNIMKYELCNIQKRKNEITNTDIIDYIEKAEIPENYYMQAYQQMIKFRYDKTIGYSSRYVTAELIGTYLYDEYKKNPKQAKEKIKNYILAMKEDDFESVLNSLGIDFINTKNLSDVQNDYITDLEARLNAIYPKQDHSR